MEYKIDLESLERDMSHGDGGSSMMIDQRLLLAVAERLEQVADLMTKDISYPGVSKK